MNRFTLILSTFLLFSTNPIFAESEVVNINDICSTTADYKLNGPTDNETSITVYSLDGSSFTNESFSIGEDLYSYKDGWERYIPITELGNGGKALFKNIADPDNIEKQFTSITLGKYITTINKNAFRGFVNVTTITLNCDQVPNVDLNAFTDCPVSTITVNVPDALYSTYKLSSNWGKIFTNIVSPSNPTAVEEVSIENAKVVNMKILFGQEVEVEVYSITGAPIYKGIASEVSLPEKGIYIIRSGNKTKKVVCK